MNTNQVKCFLTSAARLSFTAAAADMYLSPQAVSKQVSALENELGARLFERNGPRLVLTESGRLFYARFTGLSRQMKFMLEDIRLYLKRMQTSLSIGVSEWIDPAGQFMEGVGAFRQAAPGCKVSMRVLSNRELLKALNAGGIDCAIFSGGQRPQGADLVSRVIALEDVMLYTPDDIPPGPAREDCWGLPLLMVSAWELSAVELRVVGAREMTGIRLSPAETEQLPNVASMHAKMEFGRFATLGGNRFNYLPKIPGLVGHPLGARDEILCVWLRRNENAMAPAFAEKLRRFFEVPDEI